MSLILQPLRARIRKGDFYSDRVYPFFLEAVAMRRAWRLAKGERSSLWLRAQYRKAMRQAAQEAVRQVRQLKGGTL
jgi:hypothetical protein